MENASKALIIAGGVLLAMLMVSLMIFAWGRFSEFYNKQDKLDEVVELANFNSQFTNFDRDDVHGYEIISLANKIADYNTRFSIDPDAKSKAAYETTRMNVRITRTQLEKDIYYPGVTYMHLFNTTEYPQSRTRDDLVSKVIKPGLGIEKIYGGSETASKVAKSISSILAADNNDQVDYYVRITGMNKPDAIKAMKIEGVAEFQYITGITIGDSEITTADYDQMKSNYLFNNSTHILQYYEYYQFKKAIFRCTSVGYNNDNGRINSMEFEFVKIE